MIDEALARVPGALRCLDIGTGSGAIAVTLACEFPDAQVTAIDCAPEVIELARENALRHGVSACTHFITSDLLDGHENAHWGKELQAGFGPPYDLVIANLPYVPTPDLPLKPNPVGFEPRLALDGGPDGLDVYRRLLEVLPRYVCAEALLLFEAAPPTIDGLLRVIQSTFPSSHAEIGFDYAGLERYAIVTV